ncbi:hypothetical protein [Pandoravirus japonicus]|uniref:Uncharacterized protein n=1 Tax=Pandoravirus japonicus TaxID=2823154 RepID=A0A811BRC6_9VIRU|nr:hypothetical protein [Pandoravirus japonicus]
MRDKSRKKVGSPFLFFSLFGAAAQPMHLDDGWRCKCRQMTGKKGEKKEKWLRRTPPLVPAADDGRDLPPAV